MVGEAYQRYRSEAEGENSRVYPALARVDRNLFGIALVGISGRVFASGDTDCEFPIMSVSKPFVFALVCAQLGPQRMRELVGANATGLPVQFCRGDRAERGWPHQSDGQLGGDRDDDLVPGATRDEKWSFIRDGLNRFAGRQLALNDEVYASASDTNLRNRSIAQMLQSLNRVYSDPVEATDLYTRQCSLNVSARDLAVMGATLADGGINPITRERVVDPILCHYTLAVMSTAGLYETSVTGSMRLVCQVKAASAAES